MTSRTDEAVVTYVRVRRSLLAQGIAAMLALTVPVLLVLYWLTIPTGSWMWVVLGQAAVFLAMMIAVYGYLRVRVTVTPTHLLERRFFFGTNRIPLDEVNDAFELMRSGARGRSVIMF